MKISKTYHSHQDAWGEGHLVECSKGPSQVCGRHFLDVERIKTHHQAAEETEHQPPQDEDLKWLADFGGRHQTRSHHRETVHYEDGVTSGGEDERKNIKWDGNYRKNSLFWLFFVFCFFYLPYESARYLTPSEPSKAPKSLMLTETDHSRVRLWSGIDWLCLALQVWLKNSSMIWTEDNQHQEIVEIQSNDECWVQLI